MRSEKLASWRLIEYTTIAVEITGSIALGLVVAGSILALLGYDPARGIFLLVFGGLRNPDYLLSRAAFIAMTALAFSIPLLAGVFNIGGEGQMYLGGLAALLAAVYSGNAAVAILAGGLAGAALGLIIGALKAYRDVNEVVSAIMLNLTLFYVIVYAITAELYDPVAPHESIKVPKGARLGVIRFGGLKLHIIFPLMLALVAVAYYLLYHTKLGYEIRASGFSPKAARYAGIDPKKTSVYSMVIGGFFAGVGGALNVVGFTYYIDNLLTCMYGMGFTGIGVALMGRNNPIGVALASIFFSMLVLGGSRMQMLMRVPKEVADTLSGVIIVALSLPYAYRMLISYIRIRRMVGVGAEQHS
ncbi:ABC transporter permease [Candidatus Bathyarchaeota archaeon]|nr:MAG: ABC transporter permease [Candidatus Bathyarchaeota archaeon]